MLQMAYGYVRADADASCAVMLLCSACIGFFAGLCMHHSSLSCATIGAGFSPPWFWEAAAFEPSTYPEMQAVLNSSFWPRCSQAAVGQSLGQMQSSLQSLTTIRCLPASEQQDHLMSGVEAKKHPNKTQQYNILIMAQVLLDRLQPDWDLSWEVEEQQQHMLATWKLHVAALQAVRPAVHSSLAMPVACLSTGHVYHLLSLLSPSCP